jgi:hypothetical protein
VQPGANLDAQRLHRNRELPWRSGSLAAARRTSQETRLPRCSPHDPESGELRPDDGVVRIEQRTPVPFAERGLGTFATPDDDGNPYAAG